MKRGMAWLAFVLSAGAWASDRPPLSDGFDLRVPWVPSPVAVSGHARLVYELHLTNFDVQPLTLERVEIMDVASNRSVLALTGDDLRRALAPVGSSARNAQPEHVAAGASAVVYLTVPDDGALTRVQHVLRVQHGDGQESELRGGAFTVRRVDPVVLGAPLRGGRWTAVYNADWARGHRRVLYTVNGMVHVPGRFAVDWIKVDAKGHFARGDGKRPADWYGYGEPVLAVANARVAAAMDDLPEPAVVAQDRKVPMQDASGNYVALDLGQGRYVFYEHLKPGSIKVRKGDTVSRGQVIAQLGYTGSTTGPHLHMHVSDGDTPLDAEGIPYAFGHYTLRGAYPDAQAFGEQKAWDARGANAHSNDLPAPFEVIEFDAP